MQDFKFVAQVNSMLLHLLQYKQSFDSRLLLLLDHILLILKHKVLPPSLLDFLPHLLIISVHRLYQLVQSTGPIFHLQLKVGFPLKILLALYEIWLGHLHVFSFNHFLLLLFRSLKHALLNSSSHDAFDFEFAIFEPVELFVGATLTTVLISTTTTTTQSSLIFFLIFR